MTDFRVKDGGSRGKKRIIEELSDDEEDEQTSSAKHRRIQSSEDEEELWNVGRWKRMMRMINSVKHIKNKYF